MKNKNIFIGILFLCTILPAQNEITNFLVGPLNDTEELLEGYMSPFGAWFGSGLNSGWYNTARPHTFPGFDVTGGVHFITPSKEAMSFKPVLNELILDPNSNGELSTFLGPNEQTEVGFENPITGAFEKLIDAPGGLGWDYAIPMPYLQGSIGIIKNTEILFRIAPPIKIEDLEMSYWGFGFKHDIKQWIPAVKTLPFDLSFLAAYSKLNSNLSFSDSQELDFNIKAFNSNIILSKKLLGLTPYIGLGYQYSTSNLSLTGDYKINGWDGQQIMPDQQITVSDPFDLSFGGVNGLKANIGARLKLLLFTIHAEWTMAEYDIFSIGIGLNSDVGSKLIKKATKNNDTGDDN